jgi:hypothetical protein
VDVKIASFSDAHSAIKLVIPVAQRRAVPRALTTKGTKITKAAS